MKYKVDGKQVLAVLEEGDEIFESIYEIVEKLDIKFSWINGIGAAENIVIGSYSTSIKNYIIRPSHPCATTIRTFKKYHKRLAFRVKHYRWSHISINIMP